MSCTLLPSFLTRIVQQTAGVGRQSIQQLLVQQLQTFRVGRDGRDDTRQLFLQGALFFADHLEEVGKVDEVCIRWLYG